ncbi:MAG: amino acid ABC transporter permease [Clostridiales bacterium]|nr:amino acid ABC transporter permease [Clostridiales bacterium]
MSAWDIFVRQFVELEGYKLVLTGLLNTVIIAVFGLLFGFVIGSIIAVVKTMLNTKKPLVFILQKIGDLYVTVFRGTPMVVQLLVIHFVLFPVMGVNFTNIVVSSDFVVNGVVIEAIIAFSLNSGAYISEIMRGGIDAIDKGQFKAGRALGLSYSRTMLSIVLPQAFRNVLPTLGNEFIALIKETSIAGFITVVDLTRAFQAMANSTYEYIVPYLVLALFYLVIVILITLLVKFLEKKFKHA